MVVQAMFRIQLERPLHERRVRLPRGRDRVETVERVRLLAEIQRHEDQTLRFVNRAITSLCMPLRTM